jgi:hypothetical protein
MGLAMTSFQTTNFSCQRTCQLVGKFFCKFRPILDLLGPVKVNSHTATIKVAYDDPKAFECAVLSLGGQWYGYGSYNLGDSTQQGYGFRLPMSGRTVGNTGFWHHEIVLRDDGQLAFDEYGGVWGDVAGLAKLAGAYAVGKAKVQADLLGWQSEPVAGGGITIYHPSGGVLTITADSKVDFDGFMGSNCHKAAAELGLIEESVVMKEVGCQSLGTVSERGE